MARYSSIKIINSPNEPKRRYINLKYPEITVDFSDIYVYTTAGDRFDLLAQTYYKDSSLWWIISRANPTQTRDSLIPNKGEQIRIPSPSRVSVILGQYDALNQNI